ncbi:MAG: (2Fe-2S)-binding protein [Myxococcales bacterium]|nr:(2Fe-2S)-binding protein [Myxococcales bacterium]
MSEPTPAPGGTPPTFSLDGHDVPFEAGQTVLSAALAAGHYIPHLCYHPEFAPHGSCRVCTVKVDGHPAASCTAAARAGTEVDSRSEEVLEMRRRLVQFLFTEGNHFCPSCEQSGSCMLQAVGYALGVTNAHFSPLFPNRPVDASHPDVLLDFNRCILCELCIRASAEVDGKHVFDLSGRGIDKHLIVNAESGRLADTALAVEDKAMSVCPVGVILRKRRGFRVPIGERRYDAAPISVVALQKRPRPSTAPREG